MSICYICLEQKATKPAKCREKPEKLLGKPIGMYHCPDCGAMVIAGMKHPGLCADCQPKEECKMTYNLREEIAKAGNLYDGHVTNGSLNELMKVIESALSDARNEQKEKDARIADSFAEQNHKEKIRMNMDTMDNFWCQLDTAETEATALAFEIRNQET